MARKAKKKLHKMPPLSFADRLVYWTVLLLLCAAYLALLLVPLHLRDKIAFSEESVIASSDHASVYWLLVPWMTFFLMTFILWLLAYQDRRPLFGKKNFKYGPPAWPKIYPLFMKNKPCVYVSQRKKKERKRIAAALLVVLLVSFLPFPWSLYGRDCLRRDGSIVQYNMFDRQTRAFPSGEIAEIEIEPFRYSTGRYNTTTHWGIRMVFHTDTGRTYTFDHRDFRGGVSSWLEDMLALKSRYSPDIFQYRDTNKLIRVISDRELTVEDTGMLYQLFGQALSGP